jgi:ABC-type lipoprotein release transport system permease subunit
VGPGDPLTLVSVPVFLAAVGLVASYIPARRAMQVDPIKALNHE